MKAGSLTGVQKELLAMVPRTLTDQSVICATYARATGMDGGSRIVYSLRLLAKKGLLIRNDRRFAATEGES